LAKQQRRDGSNWIDKLVVIMFFKLGESVQTKDVKPFGFYGEMKPSVTQQMIDARGNRKMGIVSEIAHVTDWWIIRHTDGSFAPYHISELVSLAPAAETYGGDPVEYPQKPETFHRPHKWG
jgi:hypothetical protein